MARAANPSLLDELRQHLPVRRGPASWFASLAPGIRDELEQIKARFVAGEMGQDITRTGLSMALAKTLQLRGMKVTHHTIDRWLKNH